MGEPTSSLASAVAALPEIYQPIYGHENIGGQVSRPCIDRLQHVVLVHDAVERHLQRPLKVLDLGCAQGFFSCSLAALGADVVGIDHTAENVRVCQMLSLENPSLQLDFVQGTIEDFIATLTPGKFDLVLGLSVFHHVVHARGVAFVTDLIFQLAAKIEVGVFEMALPTEGPYWSSSQPSDPRQMLEPYPFTVELGTVHTHLSPERRPLFAASRALAVLGEQAFPFDEVTTRSHALADDTHVGTRQYFFSDAAVIKVFRLVGAIAEHNWDELRRERDFLAAHGDAVPYLPRLLGYGAGSADAWLVREKIPGRLLMDLMADGSSFDGLSVVAEVLEQAAALEALGLYHSDLRAWNVLIVPGGRAVLIDYGAIKRTRADNVWPDDVFLSFFTFLYEVAHRRVVRALPVRAPFISPFNLPPPCRELALWLWDLPVDKWSFAGLKDRWTALTSSTVPVTVASGTGLWQAAVERYLLALSDTQDTARETQGHMLGDLEAQGKRSAAQQAQTEQLEEGAVSLRNQTSAMETTLGRLAESLADHVGRAEQTLARLEADSEQAVMDRVALATVQDRLATRLDATDGERQAVAARLTASVHELREALQVQRNEAERAERSLATRLDGVAEQSDRALVSTSQVLRHEAEEARREVAVQASDAEARLAEAQAGWQAEQAAQSRHLRAITEAFAEQFEALNRSWWRRWWPGAPRIAAPALGREDATARPAFAQESRAAGSTPMNASSPPTRPFPPEVNPMPSNKSGGRSKAIAPPADEQFVFSAYLVVLGREADPEGLDYYVRLLERGVDRSVILSELAHSEEAADRRASWSDVSEALLAARDQPDHPSASSDESDPSHQTPAALAGTEALPGSTAELLDLYDEEFVRSCFMSLLRRPADLDGLGNYLRQVRSGVSRSQIIAELASSSEGRKIERPLRGLDALLEAERRARPNMLQRLLRRAGRNLFYPVEARINALENRLYSWRARSGLASDRTAGRPYRGEASAERRSALEPSLHEQTLERLEAEVAVTLTETAPGSLPPRTDIVLRRLIAAVDSERR